MVKQKAQKRTTRWFNQSTKARIPTSTGQRWHALGEQAWLCWQTQSLSPLTQEALRFPHISSKDIFSSLCNPSQSCKSAQHKYYQDSSQKACLSQHEGSYWTNNSWCEKQQRARAFKCSTLGPAPRALLYVGYSPGNDSLSDSICWDDRRCVPWQNWAKLDTRAQLFASTSIAWAELADGQWKRSKFSWICIQALYLKEKDMTGYSWKILYFSINMLLNYQGLVCVHLKIFFLFSKTKLTKYGRIWKLSKENVYENIMLSFNFAMTLNHKVYF